MVWLTGCATPAPEVIRIPIEITVIEKVYVPTELARHCPGPNLVTIETSGDIEGIAIEALVALNLCNQDKAGIRAWQESD